MKSTENKPVIWFILGYPTTHRGGIEIFAYRCARALARVGMRVNVACRHDGDLRKHYEVFCEQFIIIRALYPKIKTLSLLLRESFGSNKRIVYGHHPNGLFMLWLVSRLSRSHFVFHFHLPPFNLSRVQTTALMRADCLIFVSKATESGWKKHMPLNGIKTEIVRNGADTSAFVPPENVELAKAKLSVPETSKVISFVGRFDRQKGLHVLIKAFDQAFPRSDKTDVRLLIYGGVVVDAKEYEQELQELVRTLNREDAIEFRGRTDDPHAVYQGSDLFVIPSIWPDPQPLSVTEALSTGVPVIGSRIGGIPEILSGEFDKFLFEAGNIPELANKMREHIDWRTRDPELGLRCREWVAKHYTFDMCMGQIEKIFLELK